MQARRGARLAWSSVRWDCLTPAWRSSCKTSQKEGQLMLVDCSDGGWGCERGGCEAATAAWTCLAQCAHFNIARAAVLECVKPDFHHLKTSMRRHIGNGSSRTYSVFLCRIKDAPGVCCNFNAIFEGNRVKISGSSERNESGSDKLRHLRECGDAPCSMSPCSSCICT